MDKQQVIRVGTGNFDTSHFEHDGTNFYVGLTTKIGADITTGIDFSPATGLVQNIILGGNGRISTGTAAGSTCNIDATTSAYGEGLELRYAITDWADTYTISSAKGMYLRMESQETNASASVYGAEIYGVSNNVANTQYLWGALIYAYVKGAAGLTTSGIYALQPEITFDAATASSTVTDAAIVRAKLTGGTMADYTVLDGYRLTLGDMNGGSRTYGNGLLFEDDSGMSGTCALTTGINLNIGCTTGISIAGATTTGISITGAFSGTAVEIGVSGTAMTLTNSSHALSIVTSHSATTGTVRSAEIIQAMLVDDLSTINEVLYVNFDSAKTTGDWTNAIVGRINYTAPGKADGGMAAAICSEMSMPAAAQTGGSYYSFDAELECPASFTCAASAANPVAFMKFGVWGDATAINSFEAGGYLFHIDGVATGTDYLFEEVTVTAAQVFDAVLRINVGGADYFIGLCDDKTFA